MKTYTRILTKPAVQNLLKLMRREEDLEVTKVNSGYEVVDIMREDEFVFKAMIGTMGYLCRINAAYLPEA